MAQVGKQHVTDGVKHNRMQSLFLGIGHGRDSCLIPSTARYRAYSLNQIQISEANTEQQTDHVGDIS